jgi:16S rRNA C967 or C1407 C5-methylase (RsmB/RsmF family)
MLGNDWSAFEAALAEESPVSIRLNPLKPHFPQGFADVSTRELVPWARHGYYLASRPRFTADPLFHAGCYYVQEASSMMVEHFVSKYINRPVRALDLCAAPGGKSTHLLSILPEGSLLTANEVIRSRASILAENIAKWGNTHAVVTGSDPAIAGQLTGFFDLVLCDLPCSGEGMFRKNAEAISQWSIDNVRLCAARQRRIVADVWPALRPGGLLLYSTCTFNRLENEDNINHICQMLGADLVEPPRRFFPHLNRGEGFFIAALRKNGDSDPAPTDTEKDVRQLAKKLHVVADFTAPPKLDDRQPPHRLAMSLSPALNDFPKWEVPLETALKYLAREALYDVPASQPKGFTLITFQNIPLGFVKNLGGRANNLYPKEWRIRNL